MIEAAEMARCMAVATRHGIDWRLLCALRETENGGPGREFGVLSVPAETWEEQADVAARTIRHTIARYAKAVAADWWDDTRGCYRESFLVYFSRGGLGWDGYAPLGASNDPTGLNARHSSNLTHYYAAHCLAARGA